jgi:hypothetical protein
MFCPIKEIAYLKHIYVILYICILSHIVIILSLSFSALTGGTKMEKESESVITMCDRMQMYKIMNCSQTKNKCWEHYKVF